MTTPSKVYQNVSYQELIGFAEQNPNRRRSLEPIEIRSLLQETSLDALFLTGYSSFNLNPAGVLSVMSCISDPNYYALAPVHARLEQRIQLSTSLQEKTDTLKNTSLARKRKKLHDLIAAAYNGSRMEEKDYLDLYHGLSIMCHTHFILMKETVQDTIQDGTLQESSLKGEILFSSNPSGWSSDEPVWLADYRGRWVAVPSEMGAESLVDLLPTWLTTMEQRGWVIQWPEVDATKTELVERLSVLPTWKETDRKLTKDILSARLGRAQTIQRFVQWKST
uniref:Uncharacterized protein n=1 Tax=viral metagenome TaxID=1070528 RepID=A0A6C0HKT0_9ZZZZ